MANRLKWALEHQHWTVEQWGNVIWSNKSSIQVGFDLRQTMVFRRDREAHLPECLHSSFKSKCISIMVRGCFRWNKLGPLLVLPPGSIGSDEYIEILSDRLLAFKDDILGAIDDDIIIVRHPDDLIFMQDNAPCHKIADVMGFLAEEDIQVMDWPPNSLDLNPIENLWHMLKVKFHQHFTELHCTLSKSQGSLEKYGKVLQGVWSELNPTVVSNLIRSMPRRVQLVIEAKGGATRY